MGLIASGALVGCNGTTATTSDPAAAQPAEQLGGFEPGSKGGKLLFSTVKDGHLVQLLEMQPGVEAVLESGALSDERKIGALGDRTLSDVYRSLLPGRVPQALVEADARRATHLPDDSVPAEKTELAHGDGAVYYNDFEQQWFRGQFCNGADVCAQGWDWAFSGSINGHNETFIGMVGSEGTVNASLWLEYWYHKDPTWPWACGDCGSWWQEFDRVIVVPGHWVPINVGGDWWLQGHLDGAGGGTQVSLAARR